MEDPYELEEEDETVPGCRCGCNPPRPRTPDIVAVWALANYERLGLFCPPQPQRQSPPPIIKTSPIVTPRSLKQ